MLFRSMAPKMKAPSNMLDIGGSHGLYSAAFCTKYPSLSSTILDLPQAVEKAAPLLKAKYNGGKVNYRPGNALTDDFGENKFDLIFVSSLMHHFSDDQNKILCKKISTALKPGGFFIIQEFLRPEPSPKMEMLGAVLDLFFNLSSTSGNWSKEELITFQEGSGLKHTKINNFLMLPGFVQVIARKNI